MKTDLELEDALRETFGVYADTVTDGPAWRGAGCEAPSPLALVDAAPLFEAGDASARAVSPDSGSRRAARHRWQIPLIAAASVAAVALATAIIAPRLAHEAAGPAADGGTSATADVTTGTDVPTPAGLTATVGGDGAITVAAGNPDVVLDLYTDALCPICSDFEHRYGAALTQEVADGQLAVRYRFVDFLNGASASGDYSTRAYAALLTVARADGPGVFSRFRAALFDPANQPEENAATDLSNSELAALAGSVGASAAARQDIGSGAGVEEAHHLATATLALLHDAADAAGRSAGVPTVVLDGAPVATQSPGWINAVLGRPTSGTAAISPDALRDRSWTLVTVQSAPSGGSVPTQPAPAGATVAWTGGTIVGSSGCNDFRGDYALSGSELTVTNLVYSGAAQPCPQQYFWPNGLDGSTQWSVAGGSLTITAADGSALVFRSLD